MLTGERRPVSGRRGMVSLGKVPKPVNLPSQRLENRGLDPNVEIVPRGSVSWGAAGSPPTSASPWGNSTQASSPPVSSGPWSGAPPRPSTAGSSGAATASSGPGTVSGGGPWSGHPPRPSSAGSGTRPSSAGSLRQTQEPVPAANAWGPAAARSSSASGVVGQAQPQSLVVRPRSAETRALSPQGPPLTRFVEQANGPAAPSPVAWGGAGTARRLGEEPHQPSRFTLTRVDFPTLGSEKNPDLRPQQNKAGGIPSDRTAAVDDRVPPTEERPPLGPTGPYEEPRPTSPGAYGGQERMPEGWRREGGPYGGPPGMTEGNWHRDNGPAPMQPYGGGQPQMADTWRRDPGHGAAPGGGPSDDNWRRGGPPVGPYGPPGPGRFQPDPGFMHQQRYGPGPGPGPYGRSGGPGPGGYGRQGDMYGNAAPFGRPGGLAPPRPGPPMGPGMYQGGPYDNYYGPPGPGYGNMDEREMMMLGMNGPPGMYGNYPPGPPLDGFGRYPHGGSGPGPRHMGMNRERNDSMGYEGEGYRDGPKYKDNANFRDNAGHKDGGGFNKDGGPYKEGGRMTSYQDPGESRRGGHVMSSNLTSELQRPSSSEIPRPSSSEMQRPSTGDRPSSRGGHLGPHRDWGAAASSDEPMDFSKPVFEEDVSSASPAPVIKTSSSEPGVDSDTIQTGGESKPATHLKDEDSPELPTEKVVDSGEAKESVVSQAPQSSGSSESEHVQTRKQKEGDNLSKSRVEDPSPVEAKDQLPKKVHVSEGSEPPEKRWGRESRQSAPTRERSFEREPVSSLHGGRSLGTKRDINLATPGVVLGATAASRPGYHVGRSSNSRPTTPSVTQVSKVSAAETLVKADVVFSAVQEKHIQASDPTSPSGSDGQKSSEKVRILKRVGEGPESPHGVTVNISETTSTEVPIPSTSEPVEKDGVKLKSKSLNSHDGEKAWRPKALPAADSNTEIPRPSLAANPKQSTSGALLSGGAKDPAEKAGTDPNVDSYDYEAQRARMKEIAAQRAIQLRKEEEERIKEQKAKALAKLDELNKRFSVPIVSEPAEELSVDELTEEPAAVVVESKESEVVISEVIVQEVEIDESGSAGTGSVTPRNGVRYGRNEHGKRERAGDRKGNGRSREEHRVKMGTGEQREPTKARTAGLSSQVKAEPPLLPPPAQPATTAQAVVLIPSTGHASPVQQDLGVPSAGTSVSSGIQAQQQQVPVKVQEARHRGKLSASQLRQAARQVPPAVEAEHPAQAQGTSSDNLDKTGGWPAETHTPLDLDSKDLTLSLGSSGVSTEAPAAIRRKKTKSSGRNKQKVDGLTISTDSTVSVDPNQGWNDVLSSSNDSGNEAGKLAPKAVPVSGDVDVAKSVIQKELVPQDLKSEAVLSEQSAHIETSGSDGGSLRTNGEVPSKRPQRKSQPAKRVPARERVPSQDVRMADKPHGGEGKIWAPVRSPSGVHPAGLKGGFGSDNIPSAEIAVEKKEPVAAPQTGRARRAELERYTPKPVVKQQAQQQEEMQQQQQAPSFPQHQANESANVPEAKEVPKNSSSLSEIKFGSEARLADTSSKQSRPHSSWQQRASGGERLSAPKETAQVQHSESVESGGKPQQSSYNNRTQQNYHHRSRPLSATSEQPRPGSSHQVRDVGRNHSSASVAEKEHKHVEVPQQGRSSHSHVQAASIVTEKESKNPQEGVTPYQPPRPGSSQKNRGVESDVQNAHEQFRSHRANTSQVDRQHGAPAKLDKDHHSSHELGQGPQHPKSQSFRHQHSSVSHDKDHSQAHSGSHQQPRPAPSVHASAPEGASISRDKDHQNSHSVGPVQGRPASQSLQEKHVPTDREQSRSDHVGARQQPRSPGRQRARQQVSAHEREQTSTSHVPQQSRYRQQGHERDPQRDVPNAVHHQQHQRGASDGHWQQAGGIQSERTHSSTDLGHSNEHVTRSTSHKSHIRSVAPVDKDHPPTHSTSQQHSTRTVSHEKPQAPTPNDSQKQPHYQPVSQHQRSQQQGSQGPKVDNAHNSSHWNGERSGSPPAVRGREHGYSRRGRFAGRYSGPGRGGEIEHRREQLPKQRVPVDAAVGAVLSKVGG